ncbi:uncharacterized protein UBRO2_00274 [Ustilago bromivora]|uniref:Uncharacterized protein n=1 Tax=Ustilago bromivora TaxID=307758 RepID=A0A8H8QGL5_9BASI|nr:uncharacterized protein UBRO2_00274 [Ustilago bromivora]
MPNRVVVRALGAWMQSTAVHVVLNRVIDVTSNFYPQARAIAFLVPIAASVAGFTSALLLDDTFVPVALRNCIPDVIVSVYGYGDEFVEDSTEADGLAF